MSFGGSLFTYWFCRHTRHTRILILCWKFLQYIVVLLKKRLGFRKKKKTRNKTLKQKVKRSTDASGDVSEFRGCNDDEIMTRVKHVIVRRRSCPSFFTPKDSSIILFPQYFVLTDTLLSCLPYSARLGSASFHHNLSFVCLFSRLE